MDRWSPTLPPSETTTWLLPALMIVISVSGLACGHLKLARGWRTGDTRKLFHFIIISTATALSLSLGWGAVNLLGGLMAFYVFTVARVGEGNPLFEGIARESDAPHRGLYIVIPYLSTAAGGLLSALLFGSHASVGMVASGWGDALGEPIGIRFGRHRYRVISFAGGSGTRSLEGSAAVFLASAVGAAVVISSSDTLAPESMGLLLGTSVAVGFAAALVEALSPRGFDNLTLQLAASAVAKSLL